MSAGIQVEDNVFAPEISTIAAGQTVRWRWSGQNPHNVTADTFASRTQTSGIFEHTFEKAGTYLVRCTIHPHMLGEVNVH